MIALQDLLHLSPLFLREARLARVAVDPRGAVEALALQQAGVLLVRRADEGVAVALAPAAHADLLDGVVVPPGHGLVPRRHGHQVTQHGLGLNGGLERIMGSNLQNSTCRPKSSSVYNEGNSIEYIMNPFLLLVL